MAVASEAVTILAGSLYRIWGQPYNFPDRSDSHTARYSRQAPPRQSQESWHPALNINRQKRASIYEKCIIEVCFVMFYNINIYDFQLSQKWMKYPVKPLLL